MRQLLTTLICTLWLFVNGCSKANMATDLDTKLIDSRSTAQTLMSGNPQANGLIPISPTARGKLVWTRHYSEIDSLLQPSPRRLLLSGNVVGVVLQEDLLLYDIDGQSLRQELLADGGLAAFGVDSYCWITPNRQLSCRKYDGTLIIDGHAVPLLDDRSRLRLLYPLGNEFLAVIQYFSGLPVRNTPTSSSAYRMSFGKSAWNWIDQRVGVVTQALITSDDKKLFMVGQDSIQVYDITDGKDSGDFPTELSTVRAAMIDTNNELVLFGEKIDGEVARPLIRAYSAEGNLNWEFNLLQAMTSHQPACGAKSETYFLDSGFLFCLVNGTESWRVPHVYSGRSWINTTVNGEIIVTDATTITVFAPSGKALRQFKCPQEGDAFATPAAISSDGRILISGKHTLYCFE